MSASEQFELLESSWARFANFSSLDYKIGPLHFRLLFANPLIELKFGKAFSHLRSEASSPDLTVCIWDCSETKMPPLNWNIIHQNGYAGHSEPPFYFQYFEQIYGLSALNIEKKRAHYVFKDLPHLPWWISGSPLQSIFHAWLRSHGLQLTHAAAVSDGKNALLLTGKGGSGKSTTTLACIQDGLEYLGEDYCALSTTPEVFSLYNSAKWLPSTRKLFPQYERFIANPETADKEKALVYYSELFPGKIGYSASIKGIVSLRVGTSAELKKENLESALKSLMMSTISQLPFYHPSSLQILRELISKTECYQLTLGPDLKTNVQLLKELL